MKAHQQDTLPDRADRVAAHAPAVASVQAIPEHDWRALAARAIEPNAYFLPDWTLAIDATATGRTGIDAIAVRQRADRLTGLLPVASAWRLWRIPLPVLASGDAYGPLGTALLDQADPVAAATQIMQQASARGAHALVLRDTPLAGPVATAFTQALEAQGLAPQILHAHDRASLDATGDAETLLRDALGAKKLKELRRQRNRLADHGEVRFSVAKAAEDIPAALDIFLALEASGWKGQRGTALVQDSGDAAFIRRAVTRMAARGECEIIMLHAGETAVAAGVVLKHGNRAFWFKLGVDERFAKLSPGVQLALDLTKHACDDPAIALVDSSTNPGPHSMIDPLWRNRLAIGDIVVPLRRTAVVPLFVAAIGLRDRARNSARTAIHRLRQFKEKQR